MTQRWVRRVKRKRRKERLRPARDIQMTMRDEHPEMERSTELSVLKETGEITSLFFMFILIPTFD